MLSKLDKIVDLDCYHNNAMLQNFIDALIAKFKLPAEIDIPRLTEFFYYNDTLDKSRNINLVDYIPELAHARSLLNTV